jgi:hypothetical protein
MRYQIITLSIDWAVAALLLVAVTITVRPVSPIAG